MILCITGVSRIGSDRSWGTWSSMQVLEFVEWNGICSQKRAEACK